MLAIRLGFLASSLAPLVLASSVLFPAEVRPVEDGFSNEQAELDLAAQNWTWTGCIQLGSTCYDVYSDPKGDLWVCKACGTTNNPNKNQCRKLTPYEIAHSLWCA